MHKVGNSSIPDGAKIALSFNHGEIDHPIYGKAHPKGLIPLLLPQGEMILPPILFDKPGMDAIVKKCMPNYRHLWPDDLDEDIAGRLLDLVTLIACITPDCDFNDPVVLLCFEANIVAFAADDFFDTNTAADTLDLKQAMGLFDKIGDFLGGKYKSEEELPRISPDFEIFGKFAWSWLKRLEEHRPGWRKENLTSFQMHCQKDITAHAILNEKDSGFSESTQHFFRAYASGGNTTLQYIAWIRGLALPEQVEGNLLYQRMLFCNACCSNLLNDVIGLGRDIRKEQMEDTTILSAVVGKGVDLQAAFDRTFGQLLDCMNDIRVAMRKLGDLYKGREDVEKYLRLMQTCIDGQTIWYSMVARYGDTGTKIVRA